MVTHGHGLRFTQDHRISLWQIHKRTPDFFIPGPMSYFWTRQLYTNCNTKSDLGEFQLKRWNMDALERPEGGLTLPFLYLFLWALKNWIFCTTWQMANNWKKIFERATLPEAVMSGTCQNLIWAPLCCLKTGFTGRNASCPLKIHSLDKISEVSSPVLDVDELFYWYFRADNCSLCPLYHCPYLTLLAVLRQLCHCSNHSGRHWANSAKATWCW